VKKSELTFSVLFVFLDFLMILGGFLLAYFFRFSFQFDPAFFSYLKSIVVYLPLWTLILALEGFYKPSGPRAILDRIYNIFVAVSAGMMVLIATLFLGRETFSRLILLYAWIIIFLLLVLERALMWNLQRWLYKYQIGPHKVLIIGENEAAKAIKEEFEKNPIYGYHVIGLIPDSATEILEKITKIKKRYGLDEVICTTSFEEKEIREIFNLCEKERIHFKFIPDLLETKAANIEVETIAGIPIVFFKKTPLEGWGRILKRAFDIFFSLVALILLSPLLALIALLIKIDSKGPVFYKHKRVGQNGRLFDLLKFRTMKWEYCSGEGYPCKNVEEVFHKALKNPQLYNEFKKEYKLKEDPRLTRLGKFLRRLSLDELPQFFNVLKGEMSLVGPRPMVEKEIAGYGQSQYRFIMVKPGITGLWQISGRSNLGPKDREKLDLYYIENWSLWLDLKIILRTIPVLLTKKGAY